MRAPETSGPGDRGLAIRSVVIDFDGTICRNDVSEELFAAFATPEWKDIDLAFQQGRIGSRECLEAQAALLRAPREDLLAFAIERFPLLPSFEPFVRWARARGLELVVASDGLGFYIEPMLEAAGVHGLRVVANQTSFDAGASQPPTLGFPNAHSICVGCGTCKMLVVRECGARGGPVAFVGEGHTDRFGALYADLTFATLDLVDICRADGVPFVPWETFDDVRRGLEAAADPPGPVAPERCPGWTTDPPRWQGRAAVL